MNHAKQPKWPGSRRFLPDKDALCPGQETEGETEVSADRKTALITGASSGIGLALAREFAAGGFDLVLVARDGQRLASLAAELSGRHGVEAVVMTADLADPAAPARLYERVHEKGLIIDVLVNNAGFGHRGRLADVPLQQHLDMVQVNITALLALTRLFLANMLERGRGRILNVASTAAFQPGPKMAVYYASKSFVLFLSEALSAEVEGTGITVTCLCPGPTATLWASRAGVETSPLFKIGVMDAAVVARMAYAATMSGRRLVIPGLKNKIQAFMTRFAPRALLLKTVAYLQG